jgi:hypothetical protein
MVAGAPATHKVRGHEPDDSMKLIAVATLGILLAGCTDFRAYGSGGPPLTLLQQQSLRTLDQASQRGSQAD